MALQTTGEVAVEVDKATAYAFVADPARLAACIPGCRDLQEIGPNKYTAILSSRVAFMTVTFKVAIEVVRMVPPEAIDAKITGDGVGIPGHLTGSVLVKLTEKEPGRTSIEYAADVGLMGKLGGIGQPVFRATSAQLAKQFGANLKQAIEREVPHA